MPAQVSAALQILHTGNANHDKDAIRIAPCCIAPLPLSKGTVLDGRWHSIRRIPLYACRLAAHFLSHTKPAVHATMPSGNGGFHSV